MRELEERNARQGRLLQHVGRIPPRPFAVGSAEHVRREVDLFLASRMPLGVSWDVTVSELVPGTLDVTVDTERKAGH